MSNPMDYRPRWFEDSEPDPINDPALEMLGGAMVFVFSVAVIACVVAAWLVLR